MPAQKRIIEYDIAKGIGILLVIIGHEFIEGQVFSFIYSFHMALFFLLSGLVAKISCDRRIIIVSATEKNFENEKSILSDKLVSWYITWSIIYLMFDIFINWLWLGELNAKGIAWNVYRMISLSGNGVLWFLPALLFAKRIGIRLSKKVKNYAALLLSLLCLGIGIMWIPMIDKLNSDGIIKILYYPLAMTLRVAIMVPFFMFGLCMKDNIVKLIKSVKWWKLFILGSLLIAFTWVMASNINNPVDVHTLKIGNPIVFLTLGITGSYGIIFISAGIKHLSVIGKGLSCLGANSLLIMVTHENLKIKTLIISCLRYLGVNQLNQTIFSLLTVAILILIEIIICILFGEKINRIINKVRDTLMRYSNIDMNLGSEH